MLNSGIWDTLAKAAPNTTPYRITENNISAVLLWSGISGKTMSQSQCAKYF